jgi:uncharacterized protein (TIGR03118 family)
MSQRELKIPKQEYQTVMMNQLSRSRPFDVALSPHRLSSILFAALLAAGPLASLADEIHNSKGISYRQINIVSDRPDVALLQDTNLVNPWGSSFSPTSPFWVNNSGAGKATLYAVTNDAAGSPHVAKQGLEVRIPGQGPTGQLFNNTTNFHGNVFLFVTKDGTISGWRAALGTTAEVLTTRPGAAYTGATMLTAPDGNSLLLAANFAERTVDVYDGDMELIAQLSDPSAPAGYAPFNVQSINATIYVTFARQDADPHGEVKGRGRGFIDLLDIQTQTFHRFISGNDVGGDLRAIDAPWGLAVAPDTFGQHAGELLVGNFGTGTIMAFDERGRFKGLLKGVSGNPVVNNGLWSLAFGSGNRAGVPATLYFTAGPENETHGLFGSLEPLEQRPNGHDNRAPHVPSAIAVPSGNKLHFHGFAQGVQIYTWNGAAWSSAVPEATLFDDDGNVVVIHFAGPAWQGNDGSKVVGALPPKSVTVDTNAIPWLLLGAAHTEGPGIFARTTHIHRVNTSGGRTPSAAGTVAGQIARVPYTADYFFYEPTQDKE